MGPPEDDRPIQIIHQSQRHSLQRLQDSHEAAHPAEAPLAGLCRHQRRDRCIRRAWTQGPERAQLGHCAGDSVSEQALPAGCQAEPDADRQRAGG